MISAVVVSCNEGHLLAKCLQSLQFCDEVIVIDLESTDNTKAVADELATKYIHHERVKVVEKLRAWVVNHVSNDWILYLDPDEYLLPDLQLQIVSLLNDGIDETVAVVGLPWQFFYKEHLLEGTKWGGDKYRMCLRHKERNTFVPLIHTDMRVKDGYKEYNIPRESKNYIHHAWMQNFKQLCEKHLRYLKEEGESSYEAGMRYKFKRQIYFSGRAFWDSFYTKKGYKDGFTGLLLSAFGSWYIFAQWSMLRKYERAMSTGNGKVRIPMTDDSK